MKEKKNLNQQENKYMVLNNAEAIKHHAEELQQAAKKSEYIPAWAVGKVYNASEDLSSVTHFIDGNNKMPKQQYERISEQINNEVKREYSSGGGIDNLLETECKVDDICKLNGVTIKDYYDAKMFYTGGNVNGSNNIPNNYLLKSPEEVWEQWTEIQKLHFLIDHKITEISSSQLNTPYQQLPVNVRLAIVNHLSEGQYAKGGGVKYYNKENEYRLSRPSSNIEKEILDRVTFKESMTNDMFVGSFGWKTPQGKIAEGYLYKLDDFDKNLIKNVSLKSGEKVFRYVNRATAIGGMMPFIKINLEKSLLYFLIHNENDDIIFETRGVNAMFINIIEDKMAHGGGVGNVKVGDTIYRAWFIDDDGEESSVIIKANSLEEAEKKANLIDNGDGYFSYVSNPIKIQSEEQLFEETRNNEPIYQYAHGGKIEAENAEMVKSYNKQIAHHTKEMNKAMNKNGEVPAWVVAKMTRSASDLSDATHFMEGKGEEYATGGGVGNDIYYGVIDSNNNLVFQSKNEREAKQFSYSYGGFIVKKYSGKGKIHQYAKGGGIDVKIPPQGTMISKDKKKQLNYKKVGNNYELIVYEGEPIKLGNFSRTSFKKKSNGVVTMNHNQFINYIYTEGYVDDKMADGGGVGKESNFGKPGTGFDNPRYNSKNSRISQFYGDTAVSLTPFTDMRMLGAKVKIERNSDNTYSWVAYDNKGTPFKKGQKFQSENEAIIDFQNTKFKSGGATMAQKRKVGKVMHEFKEGTLHSGKSGKVVKNPKQAVAIALSEAGLAKKENGGAMGWKSRMKNWKKK